MVKEKDTFHFKESIPPCLGMSDVKILCSYQVIIIFLISRCPFLLHRERISTSEDEATDQTDSLKKRTASVTRATLQSPPSFPKFAELQSVQRNASTMQSGSSNRKCGVLLRSDSISTSKCVGVIGKYCD